MSFVNCISRIRLEIVASLIYDIVDSHTVEKMLISLLKHLIIGPYFILWFVPTRACMTHDGLVYQVDDSHPLYRPQQHDLIKRVSSQSSVVYEI